MFNFSTFVYPKPTPSYQLNTFNKSELFSLILVPKYSVLDASQMSLSGLIQQKSFDEFAVQGRIPCLFVKGMQGSVSKAKMMLYFHGNAEDIGHSRYFLNSLRERFTDMNFIAMEYPGYGQYQGVDISEEQIKQDALTVYNYIVNTLHKKENEIVIFGRSIGTGPACYLASQFTPLALILMSPFQSIKQVAREHVAFLAGLMKDQFVNAEAAKTITCPTLIIHGLRDSLISCGQARVIYQNLASFRKMHHYSDSMDHNEFDLESDIVVPTRLLLDSVLMAMFSERS